MAERGLRHDVGRSPAPQHEGEKKKPDLKLVPPEGLKINPADRSPEAKRFSAEAKHKLNARELPPQQFEALRLELKENRDRLAGRLEDMKDQSAEQRATVDELEGQILQFDAHNEGQTSESTERIRGLMTKTRDEMAAASEDSDRHALKLEQLLRDADLQIEKFDENNAK